uniref:Uncharacterized protein n=1 Tax=Trichobilharzia regenti TaxID=157069 RepID=A0AA85JDW8_TRIRE
MLEQPMQRQPHFWTLTSSLQVSHHLSIFISSLCMEFTVVLISVFVQVYVTFKSSAHGIGLAILKHSHILFMYIMKSCPNTLPWMTPLLIGLGLEVIEPFLVVSFLSQGNDFIQLWRVCLSVFDIELCTNVRKFESPHP